MNMQGSAKLRCPSLSRGLRNHRLVANAVSAPSAPLVVSKTSQLSQLAGMTVLSIDTGDLAIIKRFAASGLITDASESPY